MLDFFQIQCAFYIAIFSWVYVNLLTDEDMVLWWWYKLLTKYVHSNYILKPLLTCEYCVAGQLALWTYFFFPWNFFSHIAYISLTIFLVHVIKSLLK
jgi:hypothetical protein